MGNREQRRQSALPRPCVVIPLRGARGICLLWTTGPGLQGAATRCVDSKRALQPLLTTGLERRQHSNLASRWPVLHGSPSTRWPHRDIMFSAAWSVQNRTSQEQRLQEIAAFAETIGDECGSPPTLPCRHQRCSGHHHHAFDQVAGQHAANETIARSQLGEHH